MVWIGRILLVLVGLVLFAVLLLALVVAQINDTLLKPAFYIGVLDENDVYEFVLTDLAAAALEDRRAVEAAQPGDELEDTPLLASGLTTDRIVSGINRALPLAWLQETVEDVVEEFGGYITGRSDDFTLTLRADERVDVVAAEMKALLVEADASRLLYERVLIPRVGEWAESRVREGLPLGVEVTSERFVSAFRAILPPESEQLRTEGMVDEVTPYLKGERGAFIISVRLTDRLEVAVAEINEILAETPAYGLVYAEIIAPRVAERQGGVVERLPFDVTVSPDEVVMALRAAARPAWVQAQAGRVRDAASRYIAGQVDSFEVKISLVENKDRAHRALTELAEGKAQGEIDRLPACRTVEQERAVRSGGPGSLPTCVPAGMARDRVLEELDIDIGTEVERFVLAQVPGAVSFSEVELRDALASMGASDTLKHLDEVRSAFKDSWTYTQDDLRADLARDGDESDFDTLQDVRSFLADGWTYTRADFAEDVDEESGAGTMDDIDQARGLVAALRAYQWLLYALTVVPLVAIGLLRGPGWLKRVKWGAVSLMVCAGVITVLFGLVYPIGASRGLDSARGRAVERIGTDSDYAETTRLAVGKGFDVIGAASDSFGYGVATRSFIIVVLASLALVVALKWSDIAAWVRRGRQGACRLRGSRAQAVRW